MAKLKKRTASGGSNRNWDLSDQNNAVSGTYPGRLLDIKDAEGIEEPSFDDKSVMVTNDKTRFLYAVTNDDDETMLVQTFEMINSSSEKSNLIKHLTALRGKAPPMNDDDYDYCDEIGRFANVTVQAKTSQQGVEYGVVTGVSPLNKKLQGDAPGMSTEIPGGRTSPIPDWIEDDEEPVKASKPKRKPAKKKVQDDEDEEDPF